MRPLVALAALALCGCERRIPTHYDVDVRGNDGGCYNVSTGDFGSTFVNMRDAKTCRAPIKGTAK